MSKNDKSDLQIFMKMQFSPQKYPEMTKNEFQIPLKLKFSLQNRTILAKTASLINRQFP